MATITAAKTRVSEGKNTHLWELLTTTNDTGSAVGGMGARQLTVHAFGTWGAGGNVNIEGSNDGTNWDVIDDEGGTPIAFGANGFAALPVSPRFVRPFVTAGDGTTDVDVVLAVVG